MIEEKLLCLLVQKRKILDYRYFLEGDIPWVKINPEIRNELKLQMPESISSKKKDMLVNIKSLNKLQMFYPQINFIQIYLKKHIQNLMQKRLQILLP